MNRPDDPLRVVICDDHLVVRVGLRQILQSESDLQVVGEATTSAEALELTRTLRPDVIVMDLSLPDEDGARATADILRVSPETRVLVLTMHEDVAYVRAALDAGALGYVLKRAADVELVLAIRTIAAGANYIHPGLAAALLKAELPASPLSAALGQLTKREREVLQHLALGLTNQEIASLLHLSVRTVETYRANIQQKLGLRTRAELARFARDVGLS